MFRIQYASDLHLELYTILPKFSNLLEPSAPYLALAGDIGHPEQLKDFFDWAVNHWKRIFFVAGNHEYYGAEYVTRHEELKNLAKSYKNLHFLHDESPFFFCEEENVVILGLTLWTYVSNTSNYQAVADYRNIRFTISTFEALNSLHIQQKRLLESEITRWNTVGAKICVITHHMPSFRLIHPKYAMSSLNDCFASNCDALMQSSVHLWIYGHTHTCSKQVIGNTLCVCNAKGYLGEDGIGWRRDAWAELKVVETKKECIDSDVEFM